MNQIFIFNPNYNSNQDTDDNPISKPQSPISYFKIALDTQSSSSSSRRWIRKTFEEIRYEQAHTKVDLVKINMNSSEWKVLRQWLETGEIMAVDQIIVKIHLHWSGFGVNGKNSEVVHQWYNTIRSIMKSGLKLVSSIPDEGPKVFLSQTDLFDTSCCYYLTFFRE